MLAQNRLLRLYAALRHCHQAILHSKTSAELFDAICVAAVEHGDMKMAWIGIVDETTKLLQAAAAHGSGKEYLDGIQISADANEPAGRGPIGIVVREDRPYWCNDYQNDPLLTLWHERGKKAGWASSAAIPLHGNGAVIGVLGVYSAEIHAFDADIQELLLGMAADISFFLDSEATRAVVDEQRRKYEARLEGIINAIADPILVKDADSRILVVNDAACALMNIPREKTLGRTLAEDLSAAEMEFFLACDRRVLSSGNTETVEEPFTATDGKVRTLLTTKSRYIEPDGTRLLIAVLHDITKRKDTETKLAQMQELLERTGSLAKVGGWQVDLTTMKLSWTLETFRIAGIEPPVEPLLEEGINLFAPEVRPVISAAIQEAIDNGKSYDLELPIITAKGKQRWVQTQGFAEMQNGKAVRLYGTFQDITERKQIEATRAVLEAQLRQSQKLQALGTLAGGIAHDFNNIVATILGYADLAVEDAGPNAKAQGSLKEIVKSATRARALVQQILAFSRQQPATRRIRSVTEVVGEAVGLLRARLPQNVQLEFTSAREPLPARIDALQIEQVILNLGLNAIQALAGQEGKVRVSVDAVTTNAELLKTFPQLSALPAGALVRLTVSDDGPGMETGTLERVFEPFFTTKPVNEGTGLGLSVAHGIIQSHEGILLAESQPGMGATFTVFLPMIREEGITVDATVNSNNPQVGRVKQILFLDDEESMVDLVKRFLDRFGYRVVGFTHHKDALDKLSQDPAAFDLFITDFNMPGTSGLEVAGAARAIRSDLTVAVFSGYIDDALATKAAALGVSAIIPKGEGLDTFCKTVRQLLGEPEQGAEPQSHSTGSTQ